MKKILIFLALVLSLSLSTYSQDYVRIGRERSEILKEFKGYNPSQLTEKGFILVKVNIKGNILIYLFDDLGYCEYTMVVTKNFNTALEYSKYYNLKYHHLNKHKDYNDIDYDIFLNTDKKNVFTFRRVY